MCNIVLQNLGVETPSRLFEDLSLRIHQGMHVGVVASNGGGKTTLLRCMAGLIEPSSGAVTRSKGMRLGYVEQTPPERLLSMSLNEALHEGSDEPWKVGYLLDMFEVPDAYRTCLINELSGGWQKLAQIANAWVREPDALLLDEPTNHLDSDKIAFLENWLACNAGEMPMTIVSHDRAFLDATTNHTLFLRPSKAKLYGYSYSKARELLAHDDQAEKDQQQKLIKEADRLTKSANELKNIGINSGSDAAQKKSKLVAARADALRKEVSLLPQEKAFRLSLESTSAHYRVMLKISNAIIRAPGAAELFKIDELRVLQGERIVLLGPNGCGKSTLINILREAREKPELYPQIVWSTQVQLGYADQHMSQLPVAQSPFDLISTRFNLGDQRCRSLLAGAGFEVARQSRPIGTFSEGQKTRLGFLMMRLLRPSFYLLDEPTNHLDIHGQERLEHEMIEQGAAAIIASHDRAFRTSVGTRFLRIEGKRLVAC